MINFFYPASNPPVSAPIAKADASTMLYFPYLHSSFLFCVQIKTLLPSEPARAYMCMYSNANSLGCVISILSQ